MAKKIIDSKRPPLLWDTIDDAFSKINDNFTELYLTVGGGGGPVDLTNIGSSINPSDSMIYDLGTPTNRWRRLYVGGGAIYVDNAPITATGSTLELPSGTKVGGVLIKDPAEGSFKNIAISGQTTVVAEDLKDTLTLAGNGIDITTNASTDTITFNNAGVTGAVAGTGITVSAATGAVTISNSGVTAVTAGTGIGVSAGTGSVTISNSGVTELIAGSNIILSASTGAITITNGSPNILQNVWRFIAVSGEDTLDPISANATLNFAAGSNIVLTTDAITNTVTISSPNVQDIVGSIFADDSTLLVDAVDGKIVGPINSFDGANSISMDPTYGVVIGGTGGASVIGAASAPVYIGAGPSGSTSGTVTIGHGTNLVNISNATVSGTLNGNVNGNVTGNVIGNVTGDLKGSVFGSDSSMLIDGTGSRIVGPIYTLTLRTSATEIALGDGAGEVNQQFAGVAVGRYAGTANQGTRSTALGFSAGSYTQSAYAVAVGDSAGNTSQGTRAIAIGTEAGQSGQGANAIAIGYRAGNNNQAANSIVLNASGSLLDVGAAGFFVNPIREVTGPQTLYYNPVDKEITWGPVPAGGSGGGGSGGDFDLSVAADDSTLRKINSGETLKFIGANGVTTASDGEGAITINGPTNISGNAATSTRTNTLDVTNTNGLTTIYYPTFVENRTTAQTVRADVDLTYRTDTNTLTAGGFVGTSLTGNLFTNLIDSADSSQILVTPLMRFQSDVVIENELSVNNSATVSGMLTVNNLTVTGTITAQGSGTPEVYSDNEILLTAGTRVEISSSPLKMASFSTAQRDALAATNGDMIYNSSTNKFQGYANGTWVDLH